MTAGRLVLPQWMPAIDSDGIPLPNAEAFFYQNKTTILATIYADEDLTTALPNPVAANSSGRFPAIWADDGSLYSATVTADYAPQGTPFTFDDLRPSQAADAVIADQAEAAAAQAAIDAASAAQALAEIQDIAANAPDAPSVANKANRDLDNVTTADFSAKALIPTGGDTGIALAQAVPLRPEAKGAIANTESTAASTANIAAFASAATNGQILDGLDRTFVIEGRWTATDSGQRANIRNLKIKQIATTGTDRAKTIYLDGVEAVTLENITIDLNGIDAPAGVTFNEAHGITIKNCPNVLLRNVRVINGTAQTGIWLENCPNARVEFCEARDFSATLASEPTDDVMQGIFFLNCENLEVLYSGGVNLTADWPGRTAPWRRYSRGLAMSGCSNFRVIAPYGGFVDQGIDISGGDNNSGLIANVRAWDCSTYGLKIANRGNHLRILGGIISDAGWAGVVVSSQYAGIVTAQAKNLDIEGFTVINTGSSGLYDATDGRNSFQVLSSGFAGTEGYPGGIRLINCSSFDLQTVKTTDAHYAIRGASTVRPFNSTVPVNELINCRGEGLAVGGTYQIGFNFPRARVIGTTNQSLPNGADAVVIFQSVQEDSSSLYDPATGRFWAKVRGVYLLEASLEFSANPTGRREAVFAKNNVTPASRERARAIADASGTDLRLRLESTMILAPQEYADCRAYQNSGGALSLNMANCYFSMTKISDA